MLELKLAYRNLIGAGLRTWLKVGILSFSYVLIIGLEGLYTGMLKQGTHEMIKDDIAGGKYWHKNYDPYDPISFDESHGVVPPELDALVQRKKATPILIRPASIYPEGRIQSVLLKGIEPDQTILGIPTDKLAAIDPDLIDPDFSQGRDALPILIGKRMAKSNSLKIGDYLTIRWRDANGTFDAIDGKVVEIMNTKVPSIDNGKLWVPLKKLREMTVLDAQATMVVMGLGQQPVASEQPQGSLATDWEFKDQNFLLSDIIAMVKSKRVGAAIMYAILLFLVMLAIFDTQVLSIFRRRKEIGTLMALGMTRLRVIKLFTVEGTLNGVLAAGLAAIYGTPLLVLFAKYGMKMPEAADSFGLALASRLIPSYSVKLVLGTVLIVMVTVTIVSYLPTRRISKLKPTEALKGSTSC